MNHASTTSRLANYQQNVGAIQREENQLNGEQSAQDLSYVISETGAVMQGAPLYFAGGMGATMWAIDYQLYLMSQNIQRVSNTLRPIELHSFWFPDNSCIFTMRPVVQPAFSSAAFVADFIGTGDSAASKVAEVPLTDASGINSDYFSAYVAYGAQSNTPVRVAILNMRSWDNDYLFNPSNTARGSVNFTVVGNGGVLGGGGIGAASVRRLHADKGWSACGYDLGGEDNNVTWAGEQWTQLLDNGQGHFRNGAIEEEPLELPSTGTVVVNIPDTEAVIVDLTWDWYAGPNQGS